MFHKLLSLATPYLVKQASILLALGVKQLHQTFRITQAKK
jgi:hypothetical protein